MPIALTRVDQDKVSSRLAVMASSSDSSQNRCPLYTGHLLKLGSNDRWQSRLFTFDGSVLSCVGKRTKPPAIITYDPHVSSPFVSPAIPPLPVSTNTKWFVNIGSVQEIKILASSSYYRCLVYPDTSKTLAITTTDGKQFLLRARKDNELERWYFVLVKMYLYHQRSAGHRGADLEKQLTRLSTAVTAAIETTAAAPVGGCEKAVDILPRTATEQSLPAVPAKEPSRVALTAHQQADHLFQQYLQEQNSVQPLSMTASSLALQPAGPPLTRTPSQNSGHVLRGSPLPVSLRPTKHQQAASTLQHQKWQQPQQPQFNLNLTVPAGYQRKTRDSLQQYQLPSPARVSAFLPNGLDWNIPNMASTPTTQNNNNKNNHSNSHTNQERQDSFDDDDETPIMLAQSFQDHRSTPGGHSLARHPSWSMQHNHSHSNNNLNHSPAIRTMTDSPMAAANGMVLQQFAVEPSMSIDAQKAVAIDHWRRSLQCPPMMGLDKDHHPFDQEESRRVLENDRSAHQTPRSVRHSLHGPGELMEELNPDSRRTSSLRWQQIGENLVNTGGGRATNMGVDSNSGDSEAEDDDDDAHGHDRRQRAFLECYGLLNADSPMTSEANHAACGSQKEDAIVAGLAIRPSPLEPTAPIQSTSRPASTHLAPPSASGEQSKNHRLSMWANTQLSSEAGSSTHQDQPKKSPLDGAMPSNKKELLLSESSSNLKLIHSDPATIFRVHTLLPSEPVTPQQTSAGTASTSTIAILPATSILNPDKMSAIAVLNPKPTFVRNPPKPQEPELVRSGSLTFLSKAPSHQSLASMHKSTSGLVSNLRPARGSQESLRDEMIASIIGSAAASLDAQQHLSEKYLVATTTKAKPIKRTPSVTLLIQPHPRSSSNDSSQQQQPLSATLSYAPAPTPHPIARLSSQQQLYLFPSSNPAPATTTKEALTFGSLSVGEGTATKPPHFPHRHSNSQSSHVAANPSLQNQQQEQQQQESTFSSKDSRPSLSRSGSGGVLVQPQAHLQSHLAVSTDGGGSGNGTATLRPRGPFINTSSSGDYFPTGHHASSATSRPGHSRSSTSGSTRMKLGHGISTTNQGTVVVNQIGHVLTPRSSQPAKQQMSQQQQQQQQTRRQSFELEDDDLPLASSLSRQKSVHSATSSSYRAAGGPSCGTPSTWTPQQHQQQASSRSKLTSAGGSNHIPLMPSPLLDFSGSPAVQGTLNVHYHHQSPHYSHQSPSLSKQQQQQQPQYHSHHQHQHSVSSLTRPVTQYHKPSPVMAPQVTTNRLSWQQLSAYPAPLTDQGHWSQAQGQGQSQGGQGQQYQSSFLAHQHSSQGGSQPSPSYYNSSTKGGLVLKNSSYQQQQQQQYHCRQNFSTRPDPVDLDQYNAFLYLDREIQAKDSVSNYDVSRPHSPVEA